VQIEVGLPDIEQAAAMGVRVHAHRHLIPKARGGLNGKATCREGPEFIAGDSISVGYS
jgi:hypothetical protein